MPGELDSLCRTNADALVPREGESLSTGGRIKNGLKPDYRIDPETGCWEWLKTKLAGYGMAGKYGRAARAYYKRTHGLEHIPGNLDVHHRCHNPGCVNPDHLQLVPHGTHLAHHKRAASHHTLETVLEIRHRAAAGAGMRQIARDMGLHEDAVEDIVAGRTWRDAGGPIGVPPKDCAYCATPLPANRRRHRIYCGPSCKQGAHTRRQEAKR